MTRETFQPPPCPACSCRAGIEYVEAEQERCLACDVVLKETIKSRWHACQACGFFYCQCPKSQPPEAA